MSKSNRYETNDNVQSKCWQITFLKRSKIKNKE